MHSEQILCVYTAKDMHLKCSHFVELFFQKQSTLEFADRPQRTCIVQNLFPQNNHHHR